MYKKILILMSITILFFTNSLRLYATEVPGVNDEIVESIGAYVWGSIVSSSLESIEMTNNIKDNAVDVTKAIWQTADSAQKLAMEQAVVTAIETGVNVIEVSDSMATWFQDNVVNKMSKNITYNYGDQEMELLGVYLDGGSIRLSNGYFRYSSPGWGSGASETLGLSFLPGANPPAIAIYIGGQQIGRSDPNTFEADMARNYNTASSIYNMALAIAARSGIALTLEDVIANPIDNWADQVARGLSNVWNDAKTKGIAVPLDNITARTLEGDLVKWNPKTRTWEDSKGVALPIDIPVTGVEVKPKDDTGTENPPIEENPPFTVELDLDLTVPETAELNFTPLTNVFGDVTTKFPFSIPWDLKKQLSVFNVQPEAPKIDIDFSKFPYAKAGTKLTIDLSFMNPLAAAARWALTLAIDIAFILMLRRLLPE